MPSASSLSTNTRSTYGDNYRAPYTFIRGVHLELRIPGARGKREIKRRSSRSPFFFSKRERGRNLCASIRQHERDYHTRPTNAYTQQATYNVSCYLLFLTEQQRTSSSLPVLSADNLLATREIYANPAKGQWYCYFPLWKGGVSRRARGSFDDSRALLN